MDMLYDLQIDNIDVATGRKDAHLVFKNAKYINVFTEELLEGDVAINNGYIIGIGNYSGEKEIDLKGKIISPGFIDGHIHIESTMVKPSEFAKALVIHGTTTVITDPHEIVNVCGTDGIDYMLQATENLPLSVYFMMPSCVPATKIDESGAVLDSNTIKKYYTNERILGLAEMMNYFGVSQGDSEVIKKLVDAKYYNKLVDGHAPGVKGKELNAYALTGVKSDHECSFFEEAKEKIGVGQYIMIREGTAAKNLNSLIKLFDAPYYNRCMLVTDDKHPGDILEKGHINYIVKEAIKLGADPIKAIKMASFNAATYFGLMNIGAIAPGYLANFAIIDNLNDFNIESVYFKGNEVARNRSVLADYNIKVDKELEKKICNSFNISKTIPEDFIIKETGNKVRVMGLEKHELLTKDLIFDKIEDDFVKLAVLERHNNTGHIGLGYMRGYGLKKGAIASSVAHDSHNLIVAGTNDIDMSIAANALIDNEGGWAIAVDGKLVDVLPLPIAGLMSDKSVNDIEEDIIRMKSLTKELGVEEGIDPFMTLGFLSLPVIPEIKMTTYGYVDVATQKVVPTIFND